MTPDVAVKDRSRRGWQECQLDRYAMTDIANGVHRKAHYEDIVWSSQAYLAEFSKRFVQTLMASCAERDQVLL